MERAGSDPVVFLTHALELDPQIFQILPTATRKNSKHSLRFQLYLEGFPIHNGCINWLKGSSGKVLITVPDLNFTQKPIYSFSNPTAFKNPVWVVENNNWILCDRVENHQTIPKFISQTEFYDDTGKLKFVADGLVRVAESPDSLVRATVFRPDPCSRLQTLYGANLRDRSDSNSVSLTQALDTVFMRVEFSSDTFRLQNEYFQFGEYSLPTTSHARPVSAEFFFTRDDSRFEEANAFFHLNQFREFIDSLGFTGLANYPLKVDVHGMDGLDQSAYSPVLDILSFGDGNVDDAEDAAVLVHEYGHVLANAAQPSSNSGMERRSTEEGICDYLAGSYARTLSDWEWQRLFKWDAWNEFLPGRNVLSTKHYPENLVGQIHRDGEIFSSALMHIELALGRATTHKILVSSLELLVPNLSMSQAAFFFLESDSVLFGGIHTEAIVAAFTARGISPYSIIVSNSSPKGILQNPILAQFWLVQSQLFWKSDLPIQEINLFDLHGRLCQVAVPEKDKYGKISLKPLPPGYYMIGYKTQNGWNRQSVVAMP